jgi:hypothetical protein
MSTVVHHHLVPRPQGGEERAEDGAEGPKGGGVAARLKALVLDTVSSEHSRRAYGKALDDFLAFLGPRPFTRASCRAAVKTRTPADGALFWQT